MYCRDAVVGEDAGYVSLASSHVVSGAVHAKGCATAAHLLQRRSSQHLVYYTHESTACNVICVIICVSGINHKLRGIVKAAAVHL